MLESVELKLEALLNSHSRENESNTPDFILAEYMMMCLEAFEQASVRREDWYGHRHEPGGQTEAPVDVETGEADPVTDTLIGMGWPEWPGQSMVEFIHSLKGDKKDE